MQQQRADWLRPTAGQCFASPVEWAVPSVIVASGSVAISRHVPTPQLDAVTEGEQEERTCSVCHEVYQVHNKDGTVHLHGPRTNRCPGSDRPPLTAQPSASSQQQQTSQSSSASASSVPDAVNTTVVASSLSTTAAAASLVFCHPHDVGPLIKHIPKSARPACATHLASLITMVIASPIPGGLV